MPKLFYLLSFFKGKMRLFLGFCPMCNSDGPDLYDCPTCNYYSAASGNKFPPTKETTAAWWRNYKEAIDGKLMVSRLLAEHKRSKKI